MKKTNFFLFIMILFGTLSFVGCKKPVEDDDETKWVKIIESYTDNTVIVTYKNMATNAVELMHLCEQMRLNPTDLLITEACKSWKQTRQYWEQSEAFLYGPAEYNSLDPHIDSWPLDLNRLLQVLAQPDILDIDAAYVRTNFGASLVGFHAVEYVLFNNGAPRQSTQLSAAELSYLTALSRVLAEDCILLEGSWSGVEALSADKRTILTQADLTISSNFGKEFKNAGKVGSRYTSAIQAVQEIIEGCKDIADEVGNSKIADPVSSGNVLEVESWYSWNSLQDFINNINSIQNSYYGSTTGIAEHSLSTFVAEKNKDLDIEIKNNIQNAKDKIRDIGEPFRNHLDNHVGADAAIKACDNLFNSLQKIYSVLD
ncbi:MAG: peptidase M75 [Bacteroidales bacterium]|jgi:predicted lipoprotein|nr:peptidase M75 [Bacteroidales bacterium]